MILHRLQNVSKTLKNKKKHKNMFLLKNKKTKMLLQHYGTMLYLCVKLIFWYLASQFKQCKSVQELKGGYVIPLEVISQNL